MRPSVNSFRFLYNEYVRVVLGWHRGKRERQREGIKIRSKKDAQNGVFFAFKLLLFTLIDIQPLSEVFYFFSAQRFFPLHSAATFLQLTSARQDF